MAEKTANKPFTSHRAQKNHVNRRQIHPRHPENPLRTHPPTENTGRDGTTKSPRHPPNRNPDQTRLDPPSSLHQPSHQRHKQNLRRNRNQHRTRRPRKQSRTTHQRRLNNTPINAKPCNTIQKKGEGFSCSALC